MSEQKRKPIQIQGVLYQSALQYLLFPNKWFYVVFTACIAAPCFAIIKILTCLAMKCPKGQLILPFGLFGAWSVLWGMLLPSKKRLEALSADKQEQELDRAVFGGAFYIAGFFTFTSMMIMWGGMDVLIINLPHCPWWLFPLFFFFGAITLWVKRASIFKIVAGIRPLAGLKLTGELLASLIGFFVFLAAVLRIIGTIGGRLFSVIMFTCFLFLTAIIILGFAVAQTHLGYLHYQKWRKARLGKDPNRLPRETSER